MKDCKKKLQLSLESNRRLFVPMLDYKADAADGQTHVPKGYEDENYDSNLIMTVIMKN